MLAVPPTLPRRSSDLGLHHAAAQYLHLALVFLGYRVVLGRVVEQPLDRFQAGTAQRARFVDLARILGDTGCAAPDGSARARSEEHTSELQSLRHLVCR